VEAFRAVQRLTTMTLQEPHENLNQQALEYLKQKKERKEEERQKRGAKSESERESLALSEL
jgi:hypothetical protein